MSLLDQIGSSLASGVSSFVGGLPVAGFNMLMNQLGMSQQQANAKELMDYQWQKYGSPQAQVKALAAAGINPAVALGQGGTGAFAQPSVNMPTSAPVQIDNVAPMLSSLTQLKKVDKDNELVDQQIYKTLSEKNLIDEQRHGQVIANIITKEYGDKEAAARIANLGGQTALYAAEKDFTKANEELVKLKQATEKVYKELVNQNKLKAALEVKNYQRYIDSVIESNQKSAGLAAAQTLTEDELRDLKKFSIDLANHMQGLEYGFNIDTYQQRIEKFANEVGIIKWTNYLKEIESKDKEAYNAIQRLIFGKGSQEDGKILWKFINDGRQLIPFK